MKIIAIMLLFFFCTGCAALLDPSAQKYPDRSVDIPRKEAVAPLKPLEEPVTEERRPREKTEAERLNARLKEIIADSPLKTAQDIYSPVPDDPEDARNVSFSFYDADLVEVIRVFMMLLEQDYMIHPEVSGRVSLFVHDNFNTEQLVDVLAGVLRVNNVAMLRTDKVWEFLPHSEVPRHISRDRIILPDTDELPRRGQIIQGFRLNFIAASEMINIIEPYLSQSAQVYAHESKGILLVSDYPHALERISELVALFDESVFADINARVFPLKHVNAENAAEKLMDIAEQFGLEHDEVGLRSRVSFLPLERLNMVLAVTRNKQVLDFVEAWVEGLDRELPEHVAGLDRENIYVYYVQYGDAEEIVESLRGVFEDHFQLENERPREIRLDRPSEDDRQTAQALNSVSGELAGPVRFTIDRATNSIITRCKASDYANVLSVIEKLDLYPKQVLIEVIIAEVRLSDATRMGVDWQYILSLGGLADGEIRLIPGEDALPGYGGLFRVESSRRLKAALHAAVDDTQLQILSTPTLLASDNRPATINIGDQVPYPTSVRRRTEEIESDIIDTTIQYRDTGIILQVTPKINKHGMVRMEIVQEVSSLTDKSVAGIAAPVINTRTAETTLAVDDQETIVIAGLMEQQRSRIYSGVPGFSRIPGIRHLFGTSRYSYENTELLVFITPNVIASREDSSFLTRNFLTRLDELKERMK